MFYIILYYLISFKMENSEQQLTLHTYSHILSYISTDCYRFISNARYINLKDVLALSSQWTMISNSFSFFRIDSIFVEIVPIFRPERGTLNADVSPSLFLDFFPTETSVNKNFADLYIRDSALRVDPLNPKATDALFTIPPDYTLNLGKFYPVSSVSSLKGQFSCGGNSPITFSSGYVCWEVYFTVYITVCNDNK